MSQIFIRSIERAADGTLTIQSGGGLQGRGWPSPVSPPKLLDREATALENLSQSCPREAWPALEMACLDLAARTAKAPLYQFLGGPTRHKVRVLTATQGATDQALIDSVKQAQAKGAAAFSVPLPADAPARSLVNATVRRMDRLRSAAGDNADFVLLGNNRLSAGEAGRMCRALEGFHLLWFDEPCPAGNLDALKKLAGETVTPLGWGSAVTEAAVFQEMLREQVVDIVRPNLQHFGLTSIRRISALAEAYYVAVAPVCGPHPVSITAALHLAASLPNFFIQELAQGHALNLQQGYAELPS